MEENQHTPSVIARLMGLDELPPQQPFPAKQRRVLSENYLQKTASIGLRERSSFCIGLSPGMNTKKHQIVKDVFGVEIPDIYSQEKASQNMAKLKMQNYTDSRFSLMKETNSKPDYQFSTKKLHDLQAPKSYCHSAVPKPVSKIGKRSAPTTTEENTLRSLQVLAMGTTTDNVVECAIHYLKKSNFQVDPKTKMPHPATRIVVLKPSSGMFHNTKSQSISLRPDVESNVVDLKYKEFTGHENGAVDNEITERESSINSMEPVTRGFRVPRTTVQRRNRVQHQTDHILKPKPRSESISDSSPKAKVLELPSSNLFSKRRGGDTPNSFSKRSSFSKEAKKEIIERWKLMNDLQEVEIARRSQSLGEMLAAADLETRPQFSDSKRDKYRRCNSFRMHSGISGSCNPLGISRRDGWKDKYTNNSPIPNPSGSRMASGSTAGLIVNKSSPSGCHLRQKVAVAEKNSNSMKQKQKDMGNTVSRRRSMLNKSSDSSRPCISSSHSLTVDSNEMILDEIKNTLKKSDLYRGSKHGSKVSEYSARGLSSALANANVENERSSHRMFDDLQAEPNPCHLFIKDGNTFDISVGQQSWTESSQRRPISAKHNRIDPGFPQNLKESDQRSPNSVLEPPFDEEKLCISEFRDSHAGLCTMELQFVETNSEEIYSAGSEMGVSSDEDSEGGSLDLLQDSEHILKDFKTEEARDFSYLVDVLDEASLHGLNLGMSFESWHSLECPVNHSVFDLLEKKYGKQASWLKSERKLLFDRINSGLSEILHSFLDIYKMEKSLKRRWCSTLIRNDVEEELWKMLVSQENEVRKDLSGKAIGNETKWLQVEGEIGIICKEIENFLFDELAAEITLH